MASIGSIASAKPGEDSVSRMATAPATLTATGTRTSHRRNVQIAMDGCKVVLPLLVSSARAAW